MKFNIDSRKVTSEIITQEITFPYYGWWSPRKNEIIKMYPEYYDDGSETIKSIGVITISKGWAIDTRIISKHIFVKNKTIDGGICEIINDDILTFLRDYADVATEEEFLNFRLEAIKLLI
jgi:hypothetical protein